MTTRPSDQPARSSRRMRGVKETVRADPYALSRGDVEAQQARLGVSVQQVEHDFVISHILNAILSESDKFVFYGGTALSRTYLAGLRLSEDIDLLSVGPRRDAAVAIDHAIGKALDRHFDGVRGNPPLQEARIDTEACIYQVGEVQVKIQLVDGRDYAQWPRQMSRVSMKYEGIDDVELTTLSPEGFACAKLSAWCDTTRNAPRDLYDLWAMSREGLIGVAAVKVFREYGPTRGFPREWMFPAGPPSDDQWHASLAHQCIPAVSPGEAFEEVVAAWLKATADAESDDAAEREPDQGAQV